MHRVTNGDDDPFYEEFCQLSQPYCDLIYDQGTTEFDRTGALLQLLALSGEFIFHRIDADFTHVVLRDLNEEINFLLHSNRESMCSLVFDWISSIPGDEWGDNGKCVIAVLWLDCMHEPPVIDLHRRWIQRCAKSPGSAWIAEEVLLHDPTFLDGVW